MKKFIIITVILIICTISLFTAKEIVYGLVFAAFTVLWILRRVMKMKRQQPAASRSVQPTPRPAAAPTPAAAPQPSPFAIRMASAGEYRFKIAGVTFEGRQTTLRKIDEMEDEKYTGCSYGIEQTEYKGSPAIKVYAELADDNMTEKVLGFVPAEEVQDVLKIYDRVFHVDVEVYGGDDDKNYGAAATLYYDK